MPNIKVLPIGYHYCRCCCFYHWYCNEFCCRCHYFVVNASYAKMKPVSLLMLVYWIFQDGKKTRWFTFFAPKISSYKHWWIKQTVIDHKSCCLSGVYPSLVWTNQMTLSSKRQPRWTQKLQNGTCKSDSLVMAFILWVLKQPLKVTHRL